MFIIIKHSVVQKAIATSSHSYDFLSNQQQQKLNKKNTIFATTNNYQIATSWDRVFNFKIL